MQRLVRQAFGGFKLILPALLFFLILWWLIAWIEALFRPLMELILPPALLYPGVSFILGTLILCGLSLIVQATLAKRIYQFFLDQVLRLPYFRPIYKWIKDLVGILGSPDEARKQHPVMVKVGDFRMLGFQTSEGLGDRVQHNDLDDRVPIYLPMSYQIGGYTLLVEKSQVEPLDVSSQAFFSLIMSAAMMEGDRDVKKGEGAD